MGFLLAGMLAAVSLSACGQRRDADRADSGGKRFRSGGE